MTYNNYNNKLPNNNKKCPFCKIPMSQICVLAIAKIPMITMQCPRCKYTTRTYSKKI